MLSLLLKNLQRIEAIKDGLMAKAKKKAKPVKAKKPAKKVKKTAATKKPAKKATKATAKPAAKPARKTQQTKQAKAPVKKAAKGKKTKDDKPTKEQSTVETVVAESPKTKNSTKSTPTPIPARPKQVSQPATPQPKPKLVTPKKPEMPVLKIILCGPHSVYWIPNDTKIATELLDQGIHKDEHEQAKQFKVPQRRDEFLRARWLYHRVSKVKDALAREESGLPKWPQDVIGSISHKDGHVMFAKVDTNSHYGLGIDVEKLSKVKREFEEKICNRDESAIVDRVEALARMSREEVLALIFSFKESIYKTHFPMGKIPFGFMDAEITEIAYERREIIARLKKQTSPRSPVDHLVLGFYNFIEHGGEKYVVTVAEERKPLVIDNDLKPKTKVANTSKEDEEEEESDADDSDDELNAPTLTEDDSDELAP
jgi:4'-phosphopantetheinyl transferase EntD